MEILIIFVLILLNGLFAMTEIALVSSRKSRLEQMAAKGSRGAKTALELIEDPEQFLSTVQIGITLVGIFAGAYGGTALADDLTPVLEKISWLQPYAPQVAFVLIVSVITYFSLVIGELLPKSIALNYAETISVAMAPVMKVLSKIAYPLVKLLSLSTRLLQKLMFIRERKDEEVSEEELKYLIAQGTETGVLEEQESDIMASVFAMADKKAYSIMIPRKDVVWLNTELSDEENMNIMMNAHYSKFPLCRGSLDDIVGTIVAKDVLNRVTTKAGGTLETIAQPPILIHESTSALTIIDIFKNQRSYIGYVINEYGVMEGLLTLHDLMEHLVGDLPDMGEEVEIMRREDGSWLMDGATKIEKVFETLKMDDMPGFRQGRYSTLAGLIIYNLKKIPATGESFSTPRYTFEVVDTDNARIDKVLVTPIRKRK